MQTPPKANYVHVEHWKAEVEGDVGAFAYPSLRQQEQGATPTTASPLRWTKEEQRRSVSVNNAASDFVDRMELAERCLCTSPVKRQGYVRQRNQAGSTGDHLSGCTVTPTDEEAVLVRGHDGPIVLDTDA